MVKQKEVIWGQDKVRLSPFVLQALKLKWVLDDLRRVKGEVLEVGCGGGGMVEAIKFYRPDLKVMGCDVDKQAIEKARENFRKIKFVKGDVYRLPFKNSRFSAVVSFDFLEHLEKPEKALKEIRRVVKAGGSFHSFVPLEGQKGTLYHCWGGECKKKMAGHWQKYDFKGLVRMLEREDFGIKQVKYGYHYLFQAVDLVHCWLWQKLGKRPVEGKGFLGLKKMLAPLFNLESLVLAKIPGGGVSLGAVRLNKGVK